MTKINSDEVKLITNKVNKCHYLLHYRYKLTAIIKGLLAINQDPLSKPAVPFTPPGTPTKGNGEIYPYWSGPLSSGTVVAIVASKGNLDTKLSLSQVPGLKDQDYSWTEMLTGAKGRGRTVQAKLEKHDIAVFRIDN